MQFISGDIVKSSDLQNDNYPYVFIHLLEEINGIAFAILREFDNTSCVTVNVKSLSLVLPRQQLEKLK